MWERVFKSLCQEPDFEYVLIEALIGDKAFDNNWLRANLNDRGLAAVIPSRPTGPGDPA